MMTARFRPVLALAFRHTHRHISRRTISYWSSSGRECCLGAHQSMRGGLDLALVLVFQMVLLPPSQLVTWPVTVIWRFLMMTALPRPVSALAFRHPRRHIRRRTIFCLVFYWRLMGKACCKGMGQSTRRERESTLGLGTLLLPRVLWWR